MFTFTPLDYLLLALAAFFVGVAKAGLSGLMIITIVIMAEIFPEKASIGIVLPMLIIADLVAYRSYRHYSNWRIVTPLLLSAGVGVLVGVGLLHFMDDLTARRTIGGIVLAMLGLHLLKWKIDNFRLPDHLWITLTAGLLAGISTSLANAAGALVTLFLLLRHFPKVDLLGTATRFFLVINLFKFPFYVGLGLITGQTLLFNLLLAPIILVGFFGGRWFVLKMSAPLFEGIIFFSAALATVRLLFF